MIKYSVVHKDDEQKVIQSFNEYAEASYCITDCYGPEASEYSIIETQTITGE